MEVGIRRRNAPNFNREGDMNRFSHLLKKYTENSVLAKKAMTLFSARKEVDINANGTQGYVVKHGSNAGKALAHRAVRSNNNW